MTQPDHSPAEIRYFANFEGLQWKCLPNGDTFYRDPDESDQWIDGFMTAEQLSDATFQHFDGCCETDENFQPLNGGSFHRPALNLWPASDPTNPEP